MIGIRNGRYFNASSMEIIVGGEEIMRRALYGSDEGLSSSSKVDDDEVDETKHVCSASVPGKSSKKHNSSSSSPSNGAIALRGEVVVVE